MRRDGYPRDGSNSFGGKDYKPTLKEEAEVFGGLGEIRKDYFTDRLVIIPTVRRERSPLVRKVRKEGGEGEKGCSFCPGHEQETLPADLVLVQRYGSLVKLMDEENERIREWSVRIFPNRQGKVTPKAPAVYGDVPLYAEPAHGYHYTAVATMEHGMSFAKLPQDDWVNLLTAVQDKMRWLYAQRGVSYVCAYINQGLEAGAKSTHPHMELVTLPRLPPLVEQESEAVHRSMNEQGICPMCDVLALESDGPRQIIATESYLAFCPWASIYPYEFWIFPKKHQTTFLKAAQKEIWDLALIIRSTLGGLAKALDDPPFNLVFHISSEKKTSRQIHWHIEVYPRIEEWSGFELGGWIYSNDVTPEHAAEILATNAKRELAELIGIT